jgi:hypothetical protein
VVTFRVTGRDTAVGEVNLPRPRAHRNRALGWPARPAAPALLALALLGAGCSREHGGAVSSRSYRGHAHDTDITNFVSAYPAAAGSRLDDCQTCHRGGTFTEADGGRTTTKNACDYCHLVQNPATGFVEAMPKDLRATLNPYGLAYLEAGRSRRAVRSIDGRDSDGDGAANGAEVAALKYPGDAMSRPGQPSSPTRAFTMAQLRALPAHTQFQLVNATRQADDFYAAYTGVRMRDLLVAAGADPDAPAFTGVTVVAPDGYLVDFSARQVNAAFPRADFFGGLDSAGLGGACGFVRYPRPLPAGVRDRAPIPGESWLMLAYARDGRAMDSASLDVATGTIEGEGPFRLVLPPAPPGAPDRGSSPKPADCRDAWAFDRAKDHNAGPMVRGVIAIRLNPLPLGLEDFDYRNGGWAYVEDASVVVYGFGVRAR